MKRIVIDWDRIGRSSDVAAFTAEFDPDDDRSVDLLCTKLDKFIGQHLSSRFFDWSMGEDGGRIVIDGGRFGGGMATITDIP